MIITYYDYFGNENTGQYRAFLLRFSFNIFCKIRELPVHLSFRSPLGLFPYMWLNFLHITPPPRSQYLPHPSDCLLSDNINHWRWIKLLTLFFGGGGVDISLDIALFSQILLFVIALPLWYAWPLTECFKYLYTKGSRWSHA